MITPTSTLIILDITKTSSNNKPINAKAKWSLNQWGKPSYSQADMIGD